VLAERPCRVIVVAEGNPATSEAGSPAAAGA